MIVLVGEMYDCDDDVCVLMIVENEDEDDNDSVVDNDCDVVEVDDLGGDTVEEDDVVELIGRDVVVGGGGAHLLGLSQSHGSEQLLKQF